MTTAYSTNLGLALPVQGELSGTWGDTVNNGITQYSDISIAGTLTLNGDGAVTLSLTNGNAAGTNIGSTTAQYAVLRITGTLTATKVITAPSSSKIYLVDNASTGGYGVTVKASGQTGYTVAAGTRAYVYFNGTDYVLAATNDVTKFTGVLPIANGGTNGTATPTAGAVPYGTGTAYAFTSAGTSGQALVSNGASAPAFATLGVAGGGTGLATTTAYSVVFTGTTSTGAFQPSAGPGTAGQVLTSNGAGALPTFQASTGVTTGKSIAMAMIFGF